jgi:hypothetical protein
MAHYKAKTSSRLRSRAQNTSPEWLKVGASLTKLVNLWSERNDLVVYGGADSAEGRAPAAFYADIAEIEVNLPEAFGVMKPETIGDFCSKDTQLEFPMFTGIMFHEALHAQFTKWDIEALLPELDNNESRAFMLLEESRIEAKGIIERPQNRQFLRASALEMALEGVNEQSLEGMGDVWEVANLAGLSLARVDSGVLNPSDVADIQEIAESVLGEELLEALQDVWVEFQSLTTSQSEKAIALAKKWVELLRQADPEGEPQGGAHAFEPSEESEESEESEGQTGSGSELSKAIRESLEGSAIQTEMDATRELENQQTQGDWSEQAKQRAEQAKERNQRKDTAKKIFDKSHNETGSGSSSRVSERRAPTGAERASAVSIAKSLEKAKYRERSVHTRKTQAPMGKLVPRNLIQNRAMESMGKRGELPAWKSKVRKHTDEPTLSLGIMVDISGSMSSAMEAMASTAWIMSEAGRRIQARTAMVYYGEGVFPTLRVGQKLDQVSIYTAPDGTEKFGKAWEALDGELGLTYSDGVRILVIVSDGYYTPQERDRCVQALRDCKRNGVAVLWLVPKTSHDYTAKHLTAEAGWGVVAGELEVSQIASVVGKTATEALARVAQS